jgi:ankyrin repeat protein
MEKKLEIYEYMVLTPEEATELFWEELEKDNPDLQVIEDILAYSPIDVNMQDRYGWTALIEAMYRRNEKCVELLLNHPGIDVNLQDEDGDTAWDLATHSIRQKFPQLNPNA